jgi:hypothetical protein
MPVRERYQKNKERLREYNRIYLRRWRALNPHKVAPQDKEYAKNYMKQYSKKPEEIVKNKARVAVRREIRMGLMARGTCEIRECSVLGQAHHDDYAKPLEVRWLCKQHHEIEHHGEMV